MHIYVVFVCLFLVFDVAFVSVIFFIIIIVFVFRLLFL